MNGLKRWAIATTVATFTLIALGALVRASGSGLGCPDWPTCYGRLIPPTHIDQLPPGADREAFNVAKTWTEYLNRLAGVVIGLMVLTTTIKAWRARKAAPNALRPAIAALLLIALQGGIGALVVRLELDPRWVTIHLLIALVIIVLLIQVVIASRPGLDPSPTTLEQRAGLRRGMDLVLALLVLQILVGALVRGGLEVIATESPDMPRVDWLGQLGTVELVHRILAVVSVLSVAALSWRVWRRDELPAMPRRLAVAAAALVAIQYGVGVGLHWFALPPTLQVFHISFGSLLFGALVGQRMLINRD
ncbi:MAG: COX15/CtaA family protein [Planctomycetes bacterium]|nr:COX15/CtaA family protein [Planctomycetota bacterium]